MVDPACRCHAFGMRSIEESIRLIETAQTVELMASSRDGDPLAMVPIAKSDALPLIAMPLIAMPPSMRHVFRAAHVGNGRVFVEAIEAVQRS